ncbi:MAG: cyclic nucleotide-binding domain-containing protein [Deltaproteobacteria bacterium]|nr:MAG: cyclic nucleotide-binding domain-containing protein [Deltaproteobacteria bacterium]
MKHCYLAVDSGSTQKSICPLSGVTTIGRAGDNIIVIPGATVSRHHARVVFEGGIWEIEDLGSANGIVVGGERVKRAILEPGKIYQLGRTVVRFIEQDDSQHKEQNLEAVEILSTTFDDLGFQAERERAKFWSERLINAVKAVPFLSSLWGPDLMKLANGASLHVFKVGETVFSEGKRGRSIYVILAGRAKIFTRDHYGRAVELATLEASDFFGEMSFFTGRPRSANVEASATTLFMEISYASLRRLIREHPPAKKVLLEYYKNRLGENEKIFTEMGVKQRRGQPRLKESVPVNIVVISGAEGQSKQGRTSWQQAYSVDISMSGIKIALLGTEADEFRRRDQVRLEIELPSPWETIAAIGYVNQIRTSDTNKKIVLLGIKFGSMTTTDIQKLREFIYGDTHCELSAQVMF